MAANIKKDNNCVCFKCKVKPRYKKQTYCYECFYEKYMKYKQAKLKIKWAKLPGSVKSFENEVWKPVRKYIGYYEISNLGRVKSLSREQRGINGLIHVTKEFLLKATIDSNGYRTVRLYKNSVKRDYKVHQLVAMMFLEKLKGKTDVHHKDANTLNNIPNNLQWVTKSEHVRLTREQGLFWNPAGEDHPMAKLSWNKVDEIRGKFAIGGVTKRDLAKVYNVTPTTIGRIINLKCWNR